MASGEADLRWPSIAWAPAAALAMLTACGGATAPAPPTPTPEPTEQQIAAGAVNALDALTSFHFELSTDTGGKSDSGAFNLISASGDAAKPDKLKANLQASVGGFTASLMYVSDAGKHYMTDPLSKTWIEVPPQFNTVAVFSPTEGAPALVKGVQDLKKQGVEQVDGVASWHLAGTTSGDVLQPLLGATAPQPLKADVWIGQSDSLTRKITLGGAILQGEPDTTVRTLSLSKFNQQVDITAPTLGTRAS